MWNLFRGVLGGNTDRGRSKQCMCLFLSVDWQVCVWLVMAEIETWLRPEGQSSEADWEGVPVGEWKSSGTRCSTPSSRFRPKPLGGGRWSVGGRGRRRNVMMHGERGGWSIGEALCSLHPLATPQRGDIARGADLVSRGEAGGEAEVSKCSYNWCEMTVKWVTVQMAADAGSNGTDSGDGWVCLHLLNYTFVMQSPKLTQYETLFRLILTPDENKSEWKLKLLVLRCSCRHTAETKRTA